MSLFVDEKYINSISHMVRNFRKKSDRLWNFSCPVCGDSKKSKLKARGFVYEFKDKLCYKCHRCGCSSSFGELIKLLSTDVYREYIAEIYLEKGGSAITGSALVRQKALTKPKKPVYAPAKPDALVGCSPISILGPDHPARMYLESRKIPEKFFNELYWTDDFPAVVNKVDPGNKFKLKHEGRIIIPFLDRKMQLLAIQGRSLESDGVRYITIKAFAEAPRIFGMHRLAKIWKRIYVVEGPLDSLFLPNCIAMAGGDIPREFPTDKTVIVYDNEPGKKETVAKLEKAIARNYRVCIWPNTISDKDINLMILSGYSEAAIRSIIDSNSYTGLAAKLKLQHWANPKGNRKEGLCTTY